MEPEQKSKPIAVPFVLSVLCVVSSFAEIRLRSSPSLPPFESLRLHAFALILPSPFILKMPQSPALVMRTIKFFFASPPCHPAGLRIFDKIFGFPLFFLCYLCLLLFKCFLTAASDAPRLCSHRWCASLDCADPFALNFPILASASSLLSMPAKVRRPFQHPFEARAALSRFHDGIKLLHQM